MYQFASPFLCFQDLSKKYPDTFPNPVVNGMLEFEWNLFIDAKRKVCNCFPELLINEIKLVVQLEKQN